MTCVTVRSWRYPYLGVRPANVRGPLMALGAQEEPLNCVWLWRIGLPYFLADDGRTIVELAGRTAEMSADLPTLLVEEIASDRRRQSNGGNRRPIPA
jgi:hypothetical protein